MKHTILLTGMMILLCGVAYADLTDGLVAYYGFNSSNPTVDYTGNGHNLTDSGSTVVTGVLGDGRDFDGTNDFMYRNDDEGLRVSNITIALWAKIDDKVVDPNEYFLEFGTGSNLKYASLQGNNDGNYCDDFIQIRIDIDGEDYSDYGYENCEAMTRLDNINTNKWYYLVGTYNGSALRYYVDGEECTGCRKQIVGSINTATGDDLNIGRRDDGTRFYNGKLDEVGIWDRALNDSEILILYNNGTGINPYDWSPPKFPIPTISSINCTSCNIPYGDTTPPYTTSDTTPTFKFETNVSANCRIADINLNYTAMEESRNCSSGQGDTTHICTLLVDDELLFSEDYVYVSCENSVNNNQSSNASVQLQMNITNLMSNSLQAIQDGVENSVIWPGAITYDNQQVYLRDLSDNEVVAVVDKVVVYGNQRWLFNYIEEGESFAGLFNLTPAVYSLEIANLTLTEIPNRVKGFINNTRS